MQVMVITFEESIIDSS